MKYAIIAVVIAFVCAVQSALAATQKPAAPSSSLPSGVKATAPKQKAYAPPVMNEVKPKSVQPVVVSEVREQSMESAYEQGSERAAVAEEPEASQPLEPAGNAVSAPPVVLPKAPKHTAPKHVVVEREVDVEIEQDDGELEIEAEVETEVELKGRPAPKHKAARKSFNEDSYQFTDEELGISQYMKPKAAPAPKARVQSDDDKPLVDFPEPIDGYSPEYQEGRNLQEGEQPEEGAQEEGSVMIAEQGKQPGSLGFEMDTVEMLQDSIEPTGDSMEVAKRR